jgi:hypothetical protein
LSARIESTTYFDPTPALQLNYQNTIVPGIALCPVPLTWLVCTYAPAQTHRS